MSSKGVLQVEKSRGTCILGFSAVAIALLASRRPVNGYNLLQWRARTARILRANEYTEVT
ncbi:MAG: hypothetical protein ACI9WS_000746, partial [Paraglaciecola psychrophila]